jgi:methionyl aminopeptidase
MITIHKENDFVAMRKAGQLAAQVLIALENSGILAPGFSTEAINVFCHDYIIKAGAIPAPLNYKGFPKSVCTSVNHVVCHGIPTPEKILADGDIINVDVTVILDGWHGDTSRTYYIGNSAGQKVKRLIQATYNAMMKAIEIVRPGLYIHEIGRVIQDYIEPLGFSIVREYCGHGIGRIFHCAPEIVHYYSPSSVKLEAGMFFTIEPMINIGKPETKILPDKWTVVTRDKSLSAQFEHTIGVTETGYEIFTLADPKNLRDVDICKL